MEQADLIDALRHLDQIPCALDDPHRLALEAILLRLIVAMGAARRSRGDGPPNDARRDLAATSAGFTQPLTPAGRFDRGPRE